MYEKTGQIMMKTCECYYCGFDIYNESWILMGGDWFCSDLCYNSYSGADNESIKEEE